MMPGSHVLAGFRLGLRFRHELAGLLARTPQDAGLHSLKPATLHSQGIKALALDFDGVLAPHGHEAPLPETVAWLDNCCTTFGQEKLFILSNKPTQNRREWFQRHYPHMRFIGDVPKKPYPDGLQKIAALAGVPLSAVLMVDDRLLTGCLAALNAGARPAYIRKPYISLDQRPCTELFFMLLRGAERLWCGML